MAIERKIVCDACGVVQVETEPNAGFRGWGAVQGVTLNGTENPTICPTCIADVMRVLDKPKEH